MKKSSIFSLGAMRRPLGKALSCMLLALMLCLPAFGIDLQAQAPGTTPVKVSLNTQTMHGRKYYVHIVEKGQTVYSIARAYKVESYDAVTHVDIHFLHPGDTVWLPVRGQFTDAAQDLEQQKAEEEESAAVPAPQAQSGEATGGNRVQPKSNHQHKSHSSAEHGKQGGGSSSQKAAAAPAVRQTGKTLKVALMMPLHLDRMEEISTTKFDIEQRGKRTYRQFEFIEFYEGIQLGLQKLAGEGVSVELNVVDVSGKDTAEVRRKFMSHHVGESDLLIALLLRESFDQAARLAQEAGIYIVNPMATRSEICVGNPYMVKMQPSTAGQLHTILANIKSERPEAHLYIVHSGSKAEKSTLDELKRQLDERADIKYTILNWSQSAKLAQLMKNTPESVFLSLYEQGKDQNRVYVGNLLNKLTAFKTSLPVLYTLTDWTREYSDIDFSQLQRLYYHTFATGWDMTNEVHVDFLSSFREAYGTEPTTPLASSGYDLVLHLVRGLHKKGADFWKNPNGNTQELTQPIHLVRQGEGLENDRAQLYRMQELRLVPVSKK